MLLRVSRPASPPSNTRACAAQNIAGASTVYAMEAAAEEDAAMEDAAMEDDAPPGTQLALQSPLVDPNPRSGAHETKWTEWDFVTNVTGSGGRKKFDCALKCGKTYGASPKRIRGHILGLPGFGIGACKLLHGPQAMATAVFEVRPNEYINPIEVMTAINNNALAADVARQAKAAVKRAAGDDLFAAPANKQTCISPSGGIMLRLTPDECTARFVQWVVCDGLPHSLAESQHFHRFLAGIRGCPEWEPCSKKTLSDTHIPKNFEVRCTPIPLVSLGCVHVS